MLPGHSVACNVVQSPHCFANRGKRDTVRVWASLAKARHSHDNEIWILRSQVLAAQSPAFKLTSAKVLDHDVAFGGQF